MNGRDRRDLLDYQADKDLERMFDKVAELEGQTLWEAYQAELKTGTLPEVPKELSEACRDQVAASEKKCSKVWPLKKSGNCLGKVAVIALVLVCFTSALVMSVDAIRLPVLNFLVDKDNRYSMVYFGSKEPEVAELSLYNKVQSVRLPDGYSLKDQWKQDDGSFGFLLQNEDYLQLQVSFFSSIHQVNYDTEDATQTQVDLLGKDAIYLKKQGLRMIWMDDRNQGVFDVRANGLSEDEFWEYVLDMVDFLNS